MSALSSADPESPAAGPAVPFEQPVDRAAELAGRPGVVRFLVVPAREFVLIDGDGPPGPEAFAPRMPGLYTTAWTLRFALKRRGVTTKVGLLEGFWWTLDGQTDLEAILAGDPGTWRWRLGIALPPEATDDETAAALEAGRAKLAEPFAVSLRTTTVVEGRVAQLLHVGPYAEERASIARLHEAISAAGLVPTGWHHELYLGDPGRTAPERLKTLLRQPVRSHA